MSFIKFNPTEGENKKYRGVFNPILCYMYYKEKHELVSESIISVFYFQFIFAA